MEKGHQGNSIEISRIGKFSFLFFFNRIVPTMISGKRVSELVSKKMRKGQGNTKHFQCTPSHSEWNLKSAEWKHLGRRMEESETKDERLMFQCWKSHDEQDSHFYVFVIPTLRSQPKQKGAKYCTTEPKPIFQGLLPRAQNWHNQNLCTDFRVSTGQRISLGTVTLATNIEEW